MSEKINYSAIQVLPFGYSVSIVDGACPRDSFFMLPRSSLPPPRDRGREIEKKNLLLFPSKPRHRHEGIIRAPLCEASVRESTPTTAACFCGTNIIKRRKKNIARLVDGGKENRHGLWLCVYIFGLYILNLLKPKKLAVLYCACVLMVGF
ncbi:hypothetical protein CDAR_26441 [Caerostris darwini]|uniref:Uncharacterized protein n=1 Tax=Caerostris darwini TaxID=1538125 RepID=A0AAV4QE16_9ARAC|nr:hypothetical protein CDAR_26441 [Caerostris darwini]